MRVLYVLHSALMGGATIAAINLISNLEELGVEPIIVVPKFERRIDNSILIKNIKSRSWKYEQVFVNALTAPYKQINILKSAYRSIRRITFHRISYYQLSNIIEKYKPDIIHTNVGVVQEGYQISRKFNIPHVWHIREYQNKELAYKSFPSKKDVMRYYADSNTICIAKDIQEYFGLRECENSRVIYDPLFSVHEVPLCPQEKENYFLIANRISPEKGISDIIKGFAGFINTLPFREKVLYKLIIAGEGSREYCDNLKELSNNLKIEKSVEFIGFQKDVKPLMKHAKALLVGSITEGFGMMTAEANMLGCPVIGRNTTGTKEIISITGGGILFDTQTDLLNAIIKISKMSSDEICERMKVPMQIAVSAFNREKSAELVFEYYQDILKRSK